MNIKKILSNKNGFSVAEIAVAILLLIIFVSLIVTIFNNVYLSFVNSKRNSVATLYVTQISEKIEAMLYEEVTSENLTKIAYLKELNIPDAYKLNVVVTPNTENTVKKIDIEISYIVGNENNIRKVNIKKIKTRYNEVIPNKPEVYSGMVPVRYNSTLDCWVISSEKEDSWYNYYNNQWANVMLLDGLKTEDGIQVTEENKEELVGSKVAVCGSMFVWIPRFAYNENTSEIEFLYGTTNNYLNNTTNSTLEKISEEYIISPSFNKRENGVPIKGFWVSKYPAGFQECTIVVDEFKKENLPTVLNNQIIYSNLRYSSCNLGYKTNAIGQDLSSTQYSSQRISYPVFKPLTYAYNLISASDAKAVSETIASAGIFYGLTKNESSSHMMNNEEWNSIIYLAKSKYGNENIKHNSKNLANYNNQNVFSVTGYFSNVTPNDSQCSSTGNMSGVFDLNGCIWEYTFDLDNNCYVRGGDNNQEKGILALESADGGPNINKGFRVVLTKM